jgi:hypothetical protein
MLTGHASAAALEWIIIRQASGEGGRCPHQAAGFGPGRSRSNETLWFGQLWPQPRRVAVGDNVEPVRRFVAGTKPVHIYRPPGRPIEQHAMTDAKTDAKTERPHVAARQNRLREALRANLKRRKFQARGRADQPPEPEAGGPASDINDTRSDRMDQDGDD